MAHRAWGRPPIRRSVKLIGHPARGGPGCDRACLRAVPRCPPSLRRWHCAASSRTVPMTAPARRSGRPRPSGPAAQTCRQCPCPTSRRRWRMHPGQAPETRTAHRWAAACRGAQPVESRAAGHVPGSVRRSVESRKHDWPRRASDRQPRRRSTASPVAATRPAWPFASGPDAEPRCRPDRISPAPGQRTAPTPPGRLPKHQCPPC